MYHVPIELNNITRFIEKINKFMKDIHINDYYLNYHNLQYYEILTGLGLVGNCV